nr:MAG TPA: Integrase [Caudoviricetes sp.]
MPKKKAPTKTYATHVTTPTGDRVFLRAKTKEELEEKVLEAKIQLRSGVDITQDVLFADYAQTWIKAYKLGKVRPSSYASIETNLRVHVLPFFSAFKLKDVKPMHIQLFITSLSGKSKSLQDKCIRIVKNIFDSAVDNGMIPRSPVSRSDRATAENSPEEEPLTDEQALKLLNAVDGTRAYIFCLLALSTGMRRGEILGLMWEDIDFKANVIRVTHNKALILNKLDAPVTALPKTDAGRRVIPMGSLLKERLLLEKAKSKSPFVVSMLNGQSLTKSAYRALWLNVERRTAGSGSVPRLLGATYGGVKVTLDFKTHPHQLRHTYITKLFEEGLDLKQVQYLAGHSKPEMTLRVYTHFRQKQRAAETHKQVCAAVGYLAEGGVAG